MSNDDNNQNAVALAEIAGKFDIMMQNIASVKEKQEEMAENIAQIREAVYHPYHSRVRVVEGNSITHYVACSYYYLGFKRRNGL